jgi:hypothetical protein
MSKLRPRQQVLLFISAGLLAFAVGASCGSSGDENTGQSCKAAGDCFTAVKMPLKGDAVCLTRVPGGYCTHLCQTDADCCAVEGECKSRFPQLCAPFESTGQKYCFLSCEAAVIQNQDPNTFCQDNANKAFQCRSTGGGSQNRKVCVPNG